MDDWGNWRGVRWQDIAFFDATCRVGPKRGRVRALQSRIPNAGGATGRVARPVKYGGDNGKPWRGALFHRARRTRLGDDGNLTCRAEIT